MLPFSFKKSLVIATAALLCFTACDKDDNTPNPPGEGEATGEITFTVNGDGYNNQTFTLKARNRPSGFEGAIHFPDLYNTHGRAGANGYEDEKGPENECNILFGGNKTGKYSCGVRFPHPDPDSASGRTNFQLILHRNGEYNAYLFNFGIYEEPTEGSITVTKYESIGGIIEGTFVGTLLNTSDGKETKLKVTNGHFSLKRLPDVER